MKLFVFRPDGHGEHSFFVMAESQEQAEKYVEEFITTTPWANSYGWGTKYYIKEIYGPGEVAINNND